MTPVIPSTVSSISFVPVNTLSSRKNRCFSRYSYYGNSTKQALSSQRLFTTLPRIPIVFPQLRNGSASHQTIRKVSATDTDVAVEEKDSAVEVEAKEDPSTKPDVGTDATRARRRQGRKSEMPPVKDEDLVPGAIFNGKVRSIQPFGAFVDFGAFTDGLVHVSRLSDNFVKDVNDVVSLGQEVKVRLVEVNTETGRISLSMREDDSSSKPQQKKDANSDTTRSPKRSPNKPGQKREDFKKASKFVKGQDLVGTVKNFARAGAFISLPEDEEGFLPTSEEPDDGFGNVMGNTSLEVGQEVNVRVLRIARGIVTLTMKKEEDAQKMDSSLNQGVVHTATNPFVVAFRRNKDIAAFLDERETVEEAAESSAQQDSVVEVEDAVNGVTEDKDEAAIENVAETTTGGDEGDTLTKDDTEESSLTDISQNLNGEATIQDGDVEAKSEEVDSELTSVVDDLNSENADISADVNTNEEVTITSQEATVVEDKVETSISEIPQVPETQAEDVSTKEDVSVENVTNEAELETPIPEGNGSITDSNESSAELEAPIPEGNAKAAISPALVKQLRDETGAGMMDCKKALAETGGDIAKAQEYLRKKGLASADKKSSRTTAEGRIGSYIHDSRIGVLIEVNCETDFVSRGDIFRELVEDLAMQVAAYPQVEYLSTEDVPKEIVEKETKIEMQKEDLLSKPEQFRSKIVEGRVNKRLGDLALLEQPYIKDDKVAVKDWVKQTIATIGENIKVRRFIRYNLGEGLAKKNQDFAAEVAAQTAAKSAPAPAPVPVKEEPAAVETEKPVEKVATVAVSAALVKQLREETGAGMMDCKKALSETGGDLEKAQEYLRKKGLSSAEKKSTRLAAEGRIGTYIHDARIGVLIEVNCETDFVGRSENFKELVDDLAMQVAACPQVQYVSVEDIPESIVSKEKEIEMQREDILSKPENIREKIVEGRISKRLGELALLEQAYIKNDSILVKDLVKQTVAALGENIKVRRFTRFTLGEQTESTNVESET
ncbi:polyprotein of EF-Ts, chloroplastic [Silene latifolia]|uniref:polyprotein of EF-Ts, chloroplastic n=1 Tax=Silene latifolia TaxID=37657 RepID=UPI003D78257A